MQRRVAFTLPNVSSKMDTDESSDDETMELLERRRRLTVALSETPYNLILYIERAVVHADLGYPDLASGDAYRALLLTDEVRDESFEYHRQALESLRPYAVEDPAIQRKFDVLHILREVPGGGNDQDQVDGHKEIGHLAKRASIRCYQILAIGLLLCGCLKSAYDFTSRGLDASPGNEELLQAQEYIQKLAKRRLQMETEKLNINDLPDQGLVRREIYPWNHHEPNRFSQETLEILNEELKFAAPKCAVRITELPTLLEAPSSTDSYGIIPTNKQLGLFAKEDIAPGKLVLDEVSVLTANNRLKDSLCDACSSELPLLGGDKQAVACPNCDDTMFCDEICYQRAMDSYHPSICDKDVDTISKDPDAKDAPSALYLLLLARALAMSATQGVHPLSLREVKYIWGDFLPSSTNAVLLSPNAGPPPIWTLPFSFASNISGPLHILEKMDVDIFTNLRSYDLWIFNTLYSKFRGTASARVNKRDGRPDVAAVHPLWCLANHNCDPNVRWEWGGRMKLWAHDRRVLPGLEPGIKTGDEIWNHYCDIDLPVKERREWARGSLGGWCMCGRCRREATELSSHEFKE